MSVYLTLRWAFVEKQKIARIFCFGDFGHQLTVCVWCGFCAIEIDWGISYILAFTGFVWVLVGYMMKTVQIDLDDEWKLRMRYICWTCGLTSRQSFTGEIDVVHLHFVAFIRSLLFFKFRQCINECKMTI